MPVIITKKVLLRPHITPNAAGQAPPKSFQSAFKRIHRVPTPLSTIFPAFKNLPRSTERLSDAQRPLGASAGRIMRRRRPRPERPSPCSSSCVDTMKMDFQVAERSFGCELEELTVLADIPVDLAPVEEDTVETAPAPEETKMEATTRPIIPIYLTAQENTAAVGIFVQSPTLGSIFGALFDDELSGDINLFAVPETALWEAQREIAEAREVELDLERSRFLRESLQAE
ncbi:hypothetical protein BOTBODRAFT_413680 [Botryobasidium botryosum FD-172 SS1]|uniref:Uncharacterized protein n=1 Tax=Botryobasidium botryosum (strain FD-172 SS1) TaxID=930990 RepID=A0A067ML56_BOTB1|nr:hypothetical protein BOTBODRAFT_413680 [Botryobasidium botryosum FD-172 SS1]